MTNAVSDKNWWDALTQISIVLNLSPDYKEAQQLQNSAVKALDDIVKSAEQKLSDGDLEEAILLFKSAGSYKQSDQKASKLENDKAVLDQLYGQMTASANSGQWDNALKLSSQILTQYPNYRDVKTKRDSYLGQVYSSAATAFTQGNYQLAAKLFSILTTAEKNYKDANEKLGAALVELRKLKPGIYPINQILDQGQFIITMTNIEVQNDGLLKVNVVYRNNSSSTQGLNCEQSNDDASAYILLADGTRTFPKETRCSSNRGVRFEVSPGDTWDEWAIFQPIQDPTQPISISWYSWGHIDGIVLIPTE